MSHSACSGRILRPVCPEFIEGLRANGGGNLSGCVVSSAGVYGQLVRHVPHVDSRGRQHMTGYSSEKPLQGGVDSASIMQAGCSKEGRKDGTSSCS